MTAHQDLVGALERDEDTPLDHMEVDPALKVDPPPSSSNVEPLSQVLLPPLSINIPPLVSNPFSCLPSKEEDALRPWSDQTSPRGKSILVGKNILTRSQSKPQANVGVLRNRGKPPSAVTLQKAMAKEVANSTQVVLNFRGKGKGATQKK